MNHSTCVCKCFAFRTGFLSSFMYSPRWSCKISCFAFYLLDIWKQSASCVIDRFFLDFGSAVFSNFRIHTCIHAGINLYTETEIFGGTNSVEAGMVDWQSFQINLLRIYPGAGLGCRSVFLLICLSDWVPVCLCVCLSVRLLAPLSRQTWHIACPLPHD